MALKKLVFFMPPFSQYGVLHHFTQELAEAFHRSGIECRIVADTKENPKEILHQILMDPPDCTLSFNGLLPDKNGRFFCDSVQIPHIACLVDSPNHFFPLFNSSYSIVTCVDRFFCQFFQQGKSSPVLFMPHAIDKKLYASPDIKRSYDIVMLSTCIDPEQIRKKWLNKFSGKMCVIMDEAVERTFADQTTSYIEALTQTLDHHLNRDSGIDPRSINYEEVFDLLEDYIRGKDRLELIKAIQKDFQVHIFGGGLEGANWKNFFPDERSNVVVHDPISYEEANNVMKKSKIVLNSCPSIRNGAHERVFSGLACGAAVLTNENPFVKEQFVENEDIIFYQHQKFGAVSSKLATLLNNEDLRCNMVKKGYVKVHQFHTWDNRAQMLQDTLPDILKELKGTYA